MYLFCISQSGLSSVRSAYNRALENWQLQDQILRQYPPSEHRHVLAQLLHNLQATSKCHESLDAQVCKVEAQMGITEGDRWKPDHPRRMAVLEDINCRAYNESVDNLERLVVMRLFELTKLNQSGTGKMSIFLICCFPGLNCFSI